MKLTTFIVVMLALVTLTGCETKRAAGIVFDLPHERYFNENKAAEMISVGEYEKLSEEEREVVLMQIAKDNLSSLYSCNIDKKTLLLWRKQMEELQKKYQ